MFFSTLLNPRGILRNPRGNCRHKINFIYIHIKFYLQSMLSQFHGYNGSYTNSVTHYYCCFSKLSLLKYFELGANSTNTGSCQIKVMQCIN